MFLDCIFRKREKNQDFIHEPIYQLMNNCFSTVHYNIQTCSFQNHSINEPNWDKLSLAWAWFVHQISRLNSAKAELRLNWAWKHSIIGIESKLTQLLVYLWTYLCLKIFISESYFKCMMYNDKPQWPMQGKSELWKERLHIRQPGCFGVENISIGKILMILCSYVDCKPNRKLAYMTTSFIC